VLERRARERSRATRRGRGLSGIITSTDLNQRIAYAFVGFSSAHIFPAIVATYSAVLGVFDPRGDSVLSAIARTRTPRLENFRGPTLH